MGREEILDSTFTYNDICGKDCGTYGVTGKGWILNVVGGIDRLSVANINESLGMPELSREAWGGGWRWRC